MLFLPFVIYVISGCCDCEDSDFSNYTNCSFEIKNLDHSGADLFITDESQVKKEAFGLQLQLSRKEDICLIKKPLFISTAYGTSCDCPPEKIYQPLDTISNIKITTLQDFDNTHLANTEITDYFQALQSTEYLPISEFLNRKNGQLLSTFDFELVLNCMLLIPPTSSGIYQFQVDIALSDGRTFSKTSDSIELL